MLILRGACDPYLSKDIGNEGKGNDEDIDPFRKPEDAKKIGKYTPLHWASYKGYHKIVWMLLKKGLDPLNLAGILSSIALAKPSLA